jgi:hypothetical protein
MQISKKFAGVKCAGVKFAGVKFAGVKFAGVESQRPKKQERTHAECAPEKSTYPTLK